MNNYRLIESAKGIKYIICETECVAVSVIGEELDLAHCDGFEESGDDIGDDGGMTCPVHAVLNVIDSAGLNTTSNDLRAQLDKAGALLMSYNAQLAEANGQLERLKKLRDLKCVELNIENKARIESLERELSESRRETRNLLGMRRLND